jgi:flagellar protein FliS
MLARPNTYEQYKQQGVMTANPVELVVMLYDGCIKQLKLASMAINENNHENTNKCLQKAQAIIVELVNSLDFHYPIAKDLMNIYDFMLRQFVDINIQKDDERIKKLIEMLLSLREAWAQVQKTQRISNIAIMEE